MLHVIHFVAALFSAETVTSKWTLLLNRHKIASFIHVANKTDSSDTSLHNDISERQTLIRDCVMHVYDTYKTTKWIRNSYIIIPDS